MVTVLKLMTLTQLKGVANALTVEDFFKHNHINLKLTNGVIIMSNTELKEKIAKYLSENKPSLIEDLGSQFDATAWETANAMPYELCGVAKAEDFEAIWKELATWDKCIFILIHLGTVLEISGKLGEGNFGHGYYNLSHANGSCIAGHLKMDDLAGIAFLSLDLHGSVSKHVAFFNNDGKAKFYIFAGRENKAIIESVSESFEKMKEKYSINK